MIDRRRYGAFGPRVQGFAMACLAILILVLFIRLFVNEKFEIAVIKSLKVIKHNYQRLPHFIIIGAPKCGTTSLFNYLGKHPNVILPAEKELKFFGRNKLTVEWYTQQFPALSEDQISRNGFYVTGEATPSYLMGKPDNSIPIKASQILPNLKVIVMLRDPISAMFSYYNYLQSMTSEEWANNPFKGLTFTESVYLSFFQLHLCFIHYNNPDSSGYIDSNKINEQIKMESVDLVKNESDLRKQFNNLNEKNGLQFDFFNPLDQSHACYSNKLGHNLLTFASYYHGMKKWYSVFPKNQIHIIEFKNFTENIEQVMSDCLEFLQLPPHSFSSKDLSTVHNGRLDSFPEQTLIDDSIQSILHDYFLVKNLQLFSLLNTTYPHWLPQSPAPPLPG